MRRTMSLALLTAALGLAVTGTPQARTWRVRPDGTGDVPTIQAGIDSAAPGDTVLLEGGCYTGAGNRDLDYSGKAIAVRSENCDPDACVIDCQGSEADPHRGFRFVSGEGAESVLEGVTVSNGHAAGTSPENRGGALYCANSSPTLRECRFGASHAYIGGAVHVEASSPAITGCVFSDNEAGYLGGGLSVYYGSTPVLSDCHFSANTATYGGAISCFQGAPSLTGCVFQANSGHYGGGIYWGDSSTPRLNSCSFSDNSAVANGGGISLVGSSGTVTACVFSCNSAPQGSAMNMTDYAAPKISGCSFVGNSGGAGGAVRLSYFSSPRIEYCVFQENTARNGAALDSDSSTPRIRYSIFAGNSADETGGAIRFNYAGDAFSADHLTLFGNHAGDHGSGIFCSSNADVYVSNSILAYGTGAEAVYCRFGGRVTLNCCDVCCNAGGNWIECISGQYGINGNIMACPSFCDARSGDFHLCDESPCLPGNHPHGYDCGLIGAWGEGCTCGPSRIQVTTWGMLKRMHR
jgi:hypothetical protein